jgi:hypothetical protein
MEQQPIGVSILATNGTFYSPSEWEGYDALHHDKLVGIAVSDGIHKFAFDASIGSHVWGGDNQVISGVMATSDANKAITDFEGENNTHTIVEQLKDYINERGVKGSPACEKCLKYTFKNGKNGYFMSAGELQIMVNYRADIVRALKAINRRYFPAYIMTSTQYSATTAWKYEWERKQWVAWKKIYKSDGDIIPICKL